MVCDGTQRGVLRDRRCARYCRDGSTARVMEHERHVTHTLRCGLRRTAQGEVVVLTAFAPRPKPADPAHQGRSEYEELSEVVLLQEALRIPVSLEARQRSHS